MFEFIKKRFIFTRLIILWRVNLLSAAALSCSSMTNKKYKVRTRIVDVNSNEPVLCLFIIKTSRCSGSCNNINDPYANICVLDVVKN